MHPVAVVVFVPLDVELADSWNGIEAIPVGDGNAVAVTDKDLAVESIDSIGAAAIKSESVALALDSLIHAARAVQSEIPGALIEGTAWFGAAEFQEM
jgi:hypothetical protein